MVDHALISFSSQANQRKGELINTLFWQCINLKTCFCRSVARSPASRLMCSAPPERPGTQRRLGAASRKHPCAGHAFKTNHAFLSEDRRFEQDHRMLRNCQRLVLAVAYVRRLTCRRGPAADCPTCLVLRRQKHPARPGLRARSRHRPVRTGPPLHHGPRRSTARPGSPSHEP